VPDDETWFEVKITYELAHVLQRIINVYCRTGRARRTALLTRITAAIADPAPQAEGVTPMDIPADGI
jgi:hypothetical protein